MKGKNMYNILNILKNEIPYIYIYIVILCFLSRLFMFYNVKNIFHILFKGLFRLQNTQGVKLFYRVLNSNNTIVVYKSRRIN